MTFPENMDKFLDWIKSASELGNQISMVYYQIHQILSEEKNSQIDKVAYDTRTVVLKCLTAHHQQGLTAKEIFNDRFLIQKYTRKKLPQTVEAYSMCLIRLDKKWVKKEKQGKEIRYFITDKGFRKTLDVLKRAKMEHQSQEKALVASLLTKITTLKMQQSLLTMEKIPQILNINRFELNSSWGKKIVEAAESIQLLQASASNVNDRTALDSAIQQGIEACNGLLEVMNTMTLYVCLKCAQEPRS